MKSRRSRMAFRRRRPDRGQRGVSPKGVPVGGHEAEKGAGPLQDDHCPASSTSDDEEVIVLHTRRSRSSRRLRREVAAFAVASSCATLHSILDSFYPNVSVFNPYIILVVYYSMGGNSSRDLRRHRSGLVRSLLDVDLRLTPSLCRGGRSWRHQLALGSRNACLRTCLICWVS